MLDYDRENRLPEHMREGFKLYFEHGIQGGSFMTAVLSNDLREACARADDVNRYKLWDIVYWLFNEAPMGAWGSPENVETWIQEKRTQGK